VLPNVMRAWAVSVPLAIDAVERSHATMRLGVASSGRARNVTASANRVMVRQAYAEHVKRGGHDVNSSRDKRAVERFSVARGVASAPPAAAPSLPASSGGARTPRSRHPGNPFLRMLNMKRAVAKTLWAPDRPLSRDELDRINASASKEWREAQQTTGLLENWRCLGMAEAAGVPLALGDDGAPSTTAEFVPLWGQRSGQACMLTPDALVERGGAETQSAHAVWNDPRMVIPADVDRRCSSSDRDPFGCYNQKKNVCRSHGMLSPGDLATFEHLTHHVSAWVDSLGKQRAQTCENLLWLGADGRESPHAASSFAGPAPRDVVVL